MSKKQRLKFLSKCLLSLAFLGCINIQAAAQEIKEMKPTEKYCSKATGISKGFGEMIATRMKVSVKSVSLLGADSAGSYGCNIKVDTANGPLRCTGGTVYSDGEDFWIGGFCY